ncbi:ubiquitin carboxyl-terminal hydrolase 24-like [Saccostrea cucullata]|uniref:ubiquitin carboxyl-terminal hydrolase 24-like n=1 Tax=Saccostrea cuccullata TaxID=36930 RepID=UPI002ED03726
MEVEEEHVQTLLSMGFPESEIRRALRRAKNDLNEAVAYLTNDQTLPSDWEEVDRMDDVEMKDIHPRPSQTMYSPSPPPSYDEVLRGHEMEKTEENGENGGTEEENPLEFPVTNLYELEGRVFAEHWSIPYKKEESLGKCLLAATRLAEANLTEGDEHCRRFLERCMPESFQKLMTSGAVHRWNTEIQEGIFNMAELFIDMCVARLQHLPVHHEILNILTLVFNKESEYHFKNRSKRDRTYWEDKLEDGQLYTVNTGYKSAIDPYGWLTHAINRFAFKGGFNLVKKLLENEDLDAPSMAALLRPFGMCAEFLNPKVVTEILAPGMEKTIKYIQNLEEKDLKEKKIGSVSDLLASMKLLCIQMWPNHTESLDDLRLEVALRMLKSPHFNARMNALKEVTKLIEDSTSNKVSKTAIDYKTILNWLVENKVLSIALEGNIDQVQYCEKVKGIVDFLGSEITTEELAMIWKMQVGQTNHVIDNIHSIIAAAAVKFDSAQLEHLFLLIQKKWQDDHNRMKEKLLRLIGKIGRDAKEPKTTTRVLELLWDLSHLPTLSRQLIELALEEHLAILSDSFSVREQVKRNYVIKCVEDIKKGACVLPSLKQLLNICKNIMKQNNHKSEKGILHELNKNHDIIKLVTQSLIKLHKQAQATVGDGQLGPDSIVDARYPHSEFVTTHLQFLQYTLQEGALYLPWSRARDIWGTLIANSDACQWDRETCFEWFSKGLPDLEMETQTQLFQKELLKLDPSKLTEKGFACFKNFFENVNKYEHRLKTDGSRLIVEKYELLGLDYIWEICLNTPDESIADKAIQLLLCVSYTNLAVRLKKDTVSLHKKFISECSNRLEAAMIGMGGTAIAQAVTWATKTLTAAIVKEVANVPPPSRSIKLMNIERLLWIAEVYVLNVEENHQTTRTILPHGASFHGLQINLMITCESPKHEFMLLCHGNETLSSVRARIANKLRQPTDNVQIVAQDKMLDAQKNQKLLHQLEFEDNQLIQVRLAQPTMQPIGKEPMTPTSKQSFDLEQEKMLPGVVMAIEGQVFDMLYQLADLDESRITHRVRKLLMLIPTDPHISETLENIGNRGLKQGVSGDDISPRASPRKSTSASPLPSPRLPPKDVLRSLFDASAQDMSAFRVLYNLEVLSSKLMPISVDLATRISSQAFCDDFLSVGGLQMVVNVLQAESLAPEVNYTIRQGCYSICLQLARFLLCGQTVSMEMDDIHSISEDAKSASGSILSSSPHNASFNKQSAGSHAVQTMDVHTFTETVSCFMRVTWAAAAGRLHLIGTTQAMIDSTMGHGRRSRQSSSGSTASESESDGQSLHAGVCAKAQDIPTKDCNIAREALEILVTCLQIRCELISSFYSLPCTSDFIIDILVGCSNADIRNAALEQFFLLSQTECTLQRTPHHFMLQLLLKAHVPFWVSSASARGVSQRLLGQCSQYFDLLCKLLEGLSKEEQTKLQLDPPNMLEDEVAWLGNYVPSLHPDMADTDNSLLAGHLKLITTLLTCEGVDPEEHGRVLVYDILHDFLFPASKVMMDSMNTSSEEKLQEVSPKCSNCESRVAAYRLLNELAKGSYSILSDICKQLIEMHHLPQPDCANEWEYLPPVDGRARCGFVGLKNGGATCYMNSVIQQLYMVPGIPEVVLGVEEDKPDEESVFFQIQQVLGHLLESKLQYHEPERFWKVFKLWGQTVNIREQQDAFDFFQALIDQIDEHLKKIGKPEIFKRKFQGIFSDQKICKDCPHRYEREEAFLALNLTVKNATLQDSLDQFVKGELLEGDNAYFCDKCGEKRNTMKRMCIKTLPPLLCIQLKRFGYDWEANRALKFDDYFKFPWILDMEPYTTDGMARREEVLETVDSSSESENGESSVTEERSLEIVTAGSNVEHRQINYELVGVVVHSGQANAGHYYSFIKERRGDMMSNPEKGKWFKFNDTVVEEFEMTEESIESECFGGSYKAKIIEPTTSSLPDERVRYWNGYMLFYEKMEEPAKTPVSAKKSKLQTRKAILEGGKDVLDKDSFMELTELVHKGEKKGIFMEEMPASIHQIIQAENLTFVKNRDVYNMDYFRFIRELVIVNAHKESHKDFQQMSVMALQLGVRFLFNTFFRCKKKTKLLLDEWVDAIDDILDKSKEACRWLVEYLSSAEGSSYIKPFLLECPCRDVRFTMARILERVMSSHFKHGGVPTQKCFNEIVEILLQMLNKDVVDHCKHSFHYFQVIKSYVQLGTKSCSHMFLRQGFQRLMGFLIGNSGEVNQGQDTPTRRWSSIQSREFGNLHSSLAILILNCDVSKYRTEEPGEYEIRKPKTVFPTKFLLMPQDMENYVYGPESSRYIREVIHAVREVGTSLVICDMLVYCSFCNYKFSETVLKHLMHQYMTAPSNELKPVFSLLTELLMLEDPVQVQRIKMVIDGVSDSSGTSYDGLLATVRLNHATDSRRSYTCIKSLVGLASKSAPVKDYLMQIPSKWQWAVNWLKKKMSEYWAPSSTSAISNEDSNRKSFQRTYSAQSTLEEAKALLTELESQEGSPEMETNDDDGDNTSQPRDEVDDSTRRKT